MKTAAKNNHHHCDGRLLFLSDAFHRRNHQSCLPRVEEEKKKISSSSFPFLTAFGAFDEEKNENEIGDERRNSPLFDGGDRGGRDEGKNVVVDDVFVGDGS